MLNIKQKVVKKSKAFLDVIKTNINLKQGIKVYLNIIDMFKYVKVKVKQ